MERESFVLDEKGNDKWQKPRGRIPMPERGSGLLIVAMKLLVMGVEPRGSVIRLMNVANPLCGDERQERLGNGSRMTRECHVRFCGEAQGEIPWAYSPNRKLPGVGPAQLPVCRQSRHYLMDTHQLLQLSVS